MKPFTYRGGLFGGSKDTAEVNDQEAPVTTETREVTQASVNGSLKKQEEEAESDDFKMEYEEDSEKGDSSSQKSENESGFSNNSHETNEDSKKKKPVMLCLL